MARKKKNNILGANNSNMISVYKLEGDLTNKIEIPLIYNVEYMYKSDPTIINGIKSEIEEKIGSGNTQSYIEYIFEDSRNESRVDPVTNYYNLIDSSIVTPNVKEFVNRPLKIAHWEGTFPFIEYFQYNIPDDLFKVILDTDQGIQIGGVKQMTYKPILLYSTD